VSVVTGLTSIFLDESCLWIIQRADWRHSQETCDFDCFVFFCRSLYNSLLWFHVSLHIMLEFMYVHIYTFTHGSMTAKVSGTYAWSAWIQTIDGLSFLPAGAVLQCSGSWSPPLLSDCSSSCDSLSSDSHLKFFIVNSAAWELLTS